MDSALQRSHERNAFDDVHWNRNRASKGSASHNNDYRTNAFCAINTQYNKYLIERIRFSQTVVFYSYLSFMSVVFGHQFRD